jgi:hypothetical protein
MIISKGNIGKIDMSLLTPEQVESFTKEAAKVGLTLSELIAKKNELAGKETGSDAAALELQKAQPIFSFKVYPRVEFAQ